MADKPKYEIASRKDMRNIPTAISDIADPEKKLEAIVKAMKSYHSNQDKIQAEHREYDLLLSEPGKGKPYEKLFDVYKSVDKEHKKDGQLSNTSVDQYVQRIANEVMPKMFKYEPGKEGEKPNADSELHAMESMRWYLLQHDMKNDQQQGTTYARIKGAIANGNAAEATRMLIRVMLSVKENIEFERLKESLTPMEMGDETAQGGKPYQAMKKMSGIIQKKVESQLGLGTISKVKIGKDIGTFRNMLDHYAIGDYNYISEHAKASKKIQVDFSAKDRPEDKAA